MARRTAAHKTRAGVAAAALQQGTHGPCSDLELQLTTNDQKQLLQMRSPAIRHHLKPRWATQAAIALGLTGLTIHTLSPRKDARQCAPAVPREAHGSQQGRRLPRCPNRRPQSRPAPQACPGPAAPVRRRLRQLTGSPDTCPRSHLHTHSACAACLHSTCNSRHCQDVSTPLTCPLFDQRGALHASKHANSNSGHGHAALSHSRAG